MDSTEIQERAKEREAEILALAEWLDSSEVDVGSELLTHDPMGQFNNPYSYVGADPLSGVDPWGLESESMDLGSAKISPFNLQQSDPGDGSAFSAAGLAAGVKETGVDIYNGMAHPDRASQVANALGYGGLWAGAQSVIGLGYLGKSSVDLFNNGAEMSSYEFSRQYAKAAIGWIGYGSMALGGAGAVGRGASASRTFFTVQSVEDAGRLLSGGTPWPIAPTRAALGEGVYAWGSEAEALAYLSKLPQGGLQILKFSIKESRLLKLRTIMVDALENPEGWMQKYSKLWGGTPNHGADYVVRGTAMGNEHYFSSRIFPLLRFK